MADRYRELYEGFRWQVPADFNIAYWACRRWARERHRLALYWEDEAGARQAWSYWDLAQASNRLSNALAALGVKKGDRVALILPQRPETVVAYLACFQMGAIAVPLSFLFGPEALEYRIANSGARVAIVDAQTLANLRAGGKYSALLPEGTQIFQLGEMSPSDWEQTMKAHSVRTITIATLLLGFFLVSIARAQQQQQRGPSTAEERARAVKVAHQLEDELQEKKD